MKGQYIIFADDDADDLEQITGYFRQYNPSVEILGFQNGFDVIQFLDRSTFSPLVVVLNNHLTMFNTREILIHIRNHPRLKSVPVVVYSSYPSEADEEFCNSNGASWVVRMPDSGYMKQFARVIAEFCELQKH